MTYRDPPLSVTICARCKREAVGFAELDGLRYCHPDVGESCYTAESHDRALRGLSAARQALLQATHHDGTPKRSETIVACAGCDGTGNGPSGHQCDLCDGCGTRPESRER